jgi:hypothetical protein
MDTVLFSKNSKVHSTGQHTGTIKTVEDRGILDTPYGRKHKISILVESDDGAQLNQWLTLSNHPKSNLTEFREMVLGRSLSDQERMTFDPNNELVGKYVGYEVSHRQSGDKLYANIVKLWPVSEDAVDEPLTADIFTEGDDLPF